MIRKAIYLFSDWRCRVWFHRQTQSWQEQDFYTYYHFREKTDKWARRALRHA